RELPAGKGFADFAFIPRSNAGYRPAMIVELKYNKSADTAIKQIKEKNYHGALAGYSDKILLVGISYDAEGKDKKHHTCVIEELH
ncbi:MAG: PD-(D/E)XK nuclease domain-containing protein, partial [Lachnospiraceae bacterium]|nr:PD-(D/E)XK nuclease domain-containing protein [Lachnospiraceae bacterium]